MRRALPPYAILVPVFIYLSIRLRVSLFPSARLTFAAAPYLFAGDSPLVRSLARPPTFLFYKIDRTDETEETRRVWGVTREYRVGKHGNVDRP